MILSRHRSLIFWTVVIAFLVTASLVLFHAFGYRYSFERGIFIFSGSITIKTLPEAVDIFVDGELIPKKRLGILNNSIHITGLMPGEHTLRISAPGYTSWEKRVVIESGVSREFWNIILPHSDYPHDTLAATNFTERVFPHPTETARFALVKKQNNETSLVFYNHRTGDTRQVFSLPESSFDQNRKENLEWSWFENGRYVILPLTVQGIPYHFVIDATNGNFFSLEEQLGLSSIESVRWETDESHELLFVANKTLYRFGIQENNELNSLAEGVVTYNLSDNKLYILMDTGEVWQEDGDRLVTITPALPLVPGIPISLNVYDEDRITVLEQTGDRRLFLIYSDPATGFPVVKEVARLINGAQFSNDGKKLLFFGETEIGVAFADDWEVQPRRKAGEVVQVARFSDRINNVSWAENYEHIIFNRGPVVKFIELDGRDHRMIGEIKTLPAAPTQIFSLFSDNRLFFVTPGSDITSIVFPEPQGLFGQ